MIYSNTSYQVKVSVKSAFQEKQSNPDNGQFVFGYKVSIENKGSEYIQLLKRHWFILDALGKVKEVKGDGVIGEQPFIAPGKVHEYVSWCVIEHDFGKMWGSYLFHKQDNDSFFKVDIPEFILAPHYLNN